MNQCLPLIPPYLEFLEVLDSFITLVIFTEARPVHSVSFLLDLLFPQINVEEAFHSVVAFQNHGQGNRP